jgi:hypothetical protein
MNIAATRSFSTRFLLALAATFFLVTSCSLSMQLHVLRDPPYVLVVCLGVLVFAVPCSAISAYCFRKSDLALILVAQVSTVVALASWFAIRS